MGLFDRSSSTTNVSNITDTTNVGLSDISGYGFGQVEGNISIQTTDQGAVAAGVEIADRALSTVELGLDVVDRGFGSLERGLSENVDLTRDVLREGVGFADRVSQRLAENNLEFLSLSSSQVERAFDASERLSGDVTALARSFGADAFDLSRDVLDVSDNLAVQSLDVVRLSSENVADVASDFGARTASLTEDFTGALRDVTGGFGDRLGDLVGDFAVFAQGTATQLLNAIGVIQQRESGNTDARLEQITRVALIGAAIVAAFAVGGPLIAAFRK